MIRVRREFVVLFAAAVFAVSGVSDDNTKQKVVLKTFGIKKGIRASSSPAVLELLLNDIFQVRREPVEVSQNIVFKYYKDNENVYNSNGFSTDTFDEIGGCEATDKFAFILHGWRQNCNNAWITKLREKLTQYRGGCIVCIDYSRYANESYIRLMRNFNSIRNVIVDKITDLELQGFNPKNNGYMFGFSFGGQLASGVGREMKTLFQKIDLCDMAGPGFDSKGPIDHRKAAENVQCLHTSRDKGTRYYNCHQNFRLGNCGFSQIAAKDPPYGSHGLCVHMYISAFDHPFYVIPKPASCPSVLPAKKWPKNFKMGYMESRLEQVTGELFVPTSRTYPYNVALNYFSQPLTPMFADQDSDEVSSEDDRVSYITIKSANATIDDEQEQSYESSSENSRAAVVMRPVRPLLRKVIQAKNFIKRLPMMRLRQNGHNQY